MVLDVRRPLEGAISGQLDKRESVYLGFLVGLNRGQLAGTIHVSTAAEKRCTTRSLIVCE